MAVEVLFYSIEKCDLLNKKPSGQDRTAAEGKGKHRLLLVSV